MKLNNTVYCAAVTPMNQDYSIDYAGQEANLKWFKESGMGGIVVCGGTGEFVSLTTQERKDLVAFTAEKNAGALDLVVGCAAETTAEAIEHAQHAQSVGANGLLLISSYYFKASEAEMTQHFASVAKSVDIPVILYNNPGSCGTTITPAMAAELSQIENVTHLKEAAGDLFQFRAIQQAVPEDFNVMVGCDALACELIKNGARGWVSITANALPSQSQKILDCMMSGKEDEAWALYKKCLPLYDVCESPYKAIQTIKYVMDKIGCCGGPSRLPRLPLTAQEQADMDVILAKVGLL